MATSEIVFTVDVDGETVRERFTTDDVNDRRAGYLPDVAESYAQHIAVDRHGTGIDVRTVDVKRLGEPHDQYDETGGTPSPRASCCGTSSFAAAGLNLAR